MEKRFNYFDVMANKDIKVYAEWINKVQQKREDIKFDICANVNEFSSYDIVQFKYSECDVEQQYIELKGRYVDINQYEDCAVETYKIKNIMKFGAFTGNKVFLAAIYYNNNKIAIWEISPSDVEEYKIDILNCRHHTAAFDGKRVDKEMMFLPLAKAKIYNL